MFKPSLYEIRFLFIYLFIFSKRASPVATPLARKSSQSNTNRRTPKYKKIPFFDGEMCKLDFIDWLLNLKEYFDYLEICDEERVRLTFNKLDGEAKEWWEDIKIDSKHFFILGHERILSLPRLILSNCICSHQLKAYSLSLYKASLTFLS